MNILLASPATGSSSSDANSALDVIPASNHGAIIYRFCEAPFPEWFAVQDGTTGEWTRVDGSNNTYQFDLVNDVGGVAYATPSWAGVTTNVWYGTKAEIAARGVQSCPTATSKTATGSTAGFADTDQGYVNFGRRSTVVVSAASRSFTLRGVTDGAHDLIASRCSLALNGASISTTLEKIIIRRNLDPANDSAFQVIDLGAEEAFTPESATATLANLGADRSAMTVGYITANGTSAVLYADVGEGGDSRLFSGVPTERQIAGDVHLINATALSANFATDPIAAATNRGAGVYVKELEAQTLEFGPTLATPTVTITATAPYVRLRSVLDRQPEYHQYFYANFQQLGARPRSIIIEATASWIGSGAFEVIIPDFAAAGGYDDAWGLKQGVSTMWILNATGWSNEAPSPSAGTTFKNAQAAGQLVP